MIETAETKRGRGRPRKHASDAERQREYRLRKKRQPRPDFLDDPDSLRQMLFDEYAESAALKRAPDEMIQPYRTLFLMVSSRSGQTEAAAEVFKTVLVKHNLVTTQDNVNLIDPDSDENRAAMSEYYTMSQFVSRVAEGYRNALSK